jgi:predicted dienelactone hydrolase
MRYDHAPVKSPTLLVSLVLSLWFAPATVRAENAAAADVKRESFSLIDPARDRPIPVVIYTSATPEGGQLKPAIISHGYGGKNTAYGFIATYLATHGYYVASIQHEIPSDEPLPTTGKPYETRMPSWQRGVQNILFVLGELKKTQPDLDYSRLLLVGHSHGGDTSMLFAQEHPALVQIVISLDNRRMPFPRTKRPRIFSIRSSDQAADEGVIPTPDEQAKLGMKVVQLPATIHNDMWDGATDEQKADMIRHIASFLQDAE